MKIMIFDTHAFEKSYLERENSNFSHTLIFQEPRLTVKTAVLARGVGCVCCFVNDKLDAPTLQILKDQGVRLIALRSAGYNNVDMSEVSKLGIKVLRVPEYSPYAVAEHATALMLTLNRKLTKSFSRVREGNFSLNGLVGFDLHGKTVGIIGTGKIGTVLVNIMNGFGCKVLAHDISPNPNLNCRYVNLDELYQKSDIISLHVPLTPQTKHLIDESAIHSMKDGVMIINTGRGALIDTKALIKGLKTSKIGFAGLDVYEEEEGIFFEDLSGQVLQDDILARLLTFSNVILTSHQAFLTQEALTNIARVTLQNVADFESGKFLKNEILLKK